MLTENSGYGNASVLQIRLDTSQLIENIEMFLTGKKVVVKKNPDTGEVEQSLERTGRPKANEVGVQSILNALQCVVNTQVVQGNFNEERLQNYLYNCRLNLSIELMVNLYSWGIREDDYEYILDTIMSTVEPFMTRLLENKERDSYINTIRHSETSRPNVPESRFKLFGRGG